MSWNHLRGRLVTRLRNYFGRERADRERAPSAAAEDHLPKSIMSIWGVQRPPGYYERLRDMRLCREEDQVYAAMRALSVRSCYSPADLTAIRLAHWFNTDSGNYRPLNIPAVLERLKQKGRVYEVTSFFGLRKKWYAGNLLEILARAADG